MLLAKAVKDRFDEAGEEYLRSSSALREAEGRLQEASWKPPGESSDIDPPEEAVVKAVECRQRVVEARKALDLARVELQGLSHSLWSDSD